MTEKVSYRKKIVTAHKDVSSIHQEKRTASVDFRNFRIMEEIEIETVARNVLKS
jgi:hypothetical protein